MKIPRPDPKHQSLFELLVPEDPRVSKRLMFGNDAAFVNGNLFFGVYGAELFLRLSEDDGRDLMKKGSGHFEPMPGRAMKGYYLLPKKWEEDLGEARTWIAKSLAWTSSLPPKKGKK